MCNKIEIPLDIENIDITSVVFTKDNEILISVESTVEGTYCHCCGKIITKFHGHSRELKLRHLSILNQKTYLCIKPRRYICDDCENHPTTTQKLSWYDERSSCTKSFEKYMMLLLVNSTVLDVSYKADISYDIVDGILVRWVNQEIDWTEIKSLKTLGIDEISMKKGHGDFATIITSREDNGKIRLLAVLSDRKKETVEAFFLSIPNDLRKTIQNVCTDLHDGYINAAKDVFGEQITIIADRFHIAKLYRKVVDEKRISDMKQLKQRLPEADYKALENPIWILRKSPKKLSPDEKIILQKIHTHLPELTKYYLFENQLTAIFSKPLTPVQAQEEIMAWSRLVRENQLDCFDTFLETLETYIKPITNYFKNRLTSGFVEGLNNKIKVIKRRCYGIFIREHLFQRISLDLTGYVKFA